MSYVSLLMCQTPAIMESGKKLVYTGELSLC